MHAEAAVRLANSAFRILAWARLLAYCEEEIADPVGTAEVMISVAGSALEGAAVVEEVLCEEVLDDDRSVWAVVGSIV